MLCALATLGAGGDSDSCQYAKDGVCDEPRNCPLGTDETDCAAACANSPQTAPPAACYYRGAPPPPSGPALPPGPGSNGTGGVRGTWDGNILAANPDGSGPLVSRYFRVYVPDRYSPARPMPLIFSMIGFASPMYSLPSYTELERTADQNGFIVVYLEALRRDFGDPLGYVWDWSVYANGVCALAGGSAEVATCATPGTAGADCESDADCNGGLVCQPINEWLPQGDWSADPDVDFIRRLAARLETLYDVDLSRIYVSGHSRGAGEAIIAAFELPGLVAGFAEECGFVQINGFDKAIAAYAAAGNPHVHGVIVHGTIDSNVSFCEALDFASTLNAAGYVIGQDYNFMELPGVGHRWQSWLNQQVWDFLYAHPLALDGGP